MAEDNDKEQKTEDATPKRREKSREQGDVSKSQDVSSVAALTAATAAIVLGWPLISSSLAGGAAMIFGSLDIKGKMLFASFVAGKSILGAVAPIAITVLIVGVATNIAQIGFLFTLEKFKPNIARFNPLPKLKSIFFSLNALLELAKAVVKVAVIGSLAVKVLIEELENHGRLAGLSVADLLHQLGTIALKIVLHVGLALAVIAVLDLLIERYRYKEKLKMTKEEVKQERKDSDGDPTTKRRIRQKQMEMGRKRMLKNIAMADVVVVNPTHFSVGLKYNLAEDPAPVIVAMGVDDLAWKIRERARHLGIPVVSNPPLARGLYKKGKVGGFIPSEYYSTVASLLAWVFNITGRVA